MTVKVPTAAPPALSSLYQQTYRGRMTDASTVAEEALARRMLPAPSERRAIREAAGVSQRRLARDVGVTATAVATWESGRSEPRGDHLVQYARVLVELAGVVAEIRAVVV